MDNLIKSCRRLLRAYKVGSLGNTTMPEDTHPRFAAEEHDLRLAYFTLPMALNYQRDSYKLWEASYRTYLDLQTKCVFDISKAAKLPRTTLREHLTKHKLALQPNKHVDTWQKISQTIYKHWENIDSLMEYVRYDFLKLKDVIQQEYKKGFPYLSGPKIFNYWSFIIQCSVKLGVITAREAHTMSREAISKRWRTLLSGSGITPIQMHPPLWFWSRNGFKYNP